jgi:hypothetical protein
MVAADFLPPHRSAEEILAHPRFPVARDEFANAMLALYEHEPFLNRLLLEAGRAVLFVMIMCLHARYDENERATWPTLRLLTDSMEPYGLASPSRIHDLVTRLISTGYLEQRASPRDGRIRILTPTAKMIAQDQDFLVSHYVPLTILYPEPGYARIMQRDPAFQQAHRLVSSGLFAHGARLLAGNPVMMLFMKRETGIMVFIKLLKAVGAHQDAVLQEVSYSDIGARFGVSRTFVRQLLVDAEELGLVRLTKGKGQLVHVLPPMVQAFDRLVADSMAGHDLVYNLTMQSWAPR